MRDKKKEIEEVYEKKRQKMVTYFIRDVKDMQDAEDLVQDAFVKSIEKNHLMTSDAKMSTWIYSIGNNINLHNLRRKRLRAKEKFCDGERDLFDKGYGPYIYNRHNGQGLFDKELVDLVEELPNRQRVAVYERVINGMEVPEIAKKHGLNVESTKTNLRQGLINLRKKYEKMGK